MLRRGLRAGMRRREFIIGLGSAITLQPHARAQQSARMPRIGIITGTAEADPQIKSWVGGFMRGLEELGWHPGRNVTLDFRWGDGNMAGIRSHAAEFVRQSPDVVFSIGTASTGAMKEAGGSVPVVFAVVNDPVAQGYVSSMAKPGGNITGFSLMENYSVLGKSIGFLKQLSPEITRIAMLFNPDTYPYYETYLKSTTGPLDVSGMRVHSVAEIETEIAKISGHAGIGLLVAPDTFTNVNRGPIIRAAAQHRIPATYPYRQYVVDGGLMAYGPEPAETVRRAATYVDRILKGEKPADLPIQAPTKLELVINAKIAKALGIQVPSNLMFTADEVIE